MFPKIEICNKTDQPLYLGFNARGVQGIWLAPANEIGDCYVFVGLDVNDLRVRETLKNMLSSDPPQVSVRQVESVEEFLMS